MFRYLGIFEPAGEGGFVVRIPDVPGVVTQGDNIADAREMAVDGLELLLSSYIERGDELPEIKTKRARHSAWVEPSALAQMKLALYLEFRKSRLSKTELARRMGIVKQQVDRLFDLQHSSRVEQLEMAFAALGKSLTISVEDSA